MEIMFASPQKTNIKYIFLSQIPPIVNLAFPPAWKPTHDFGRASVRPFFDSEQTPRERLKQGKVSLSTTRKLAQIIKKITVHFF